jgi:hypothetical protein
LRRAAGLEIPPHELSATDHGCKQRVWNGNGMLPARRACHKISPLPAWIWSRLV